ncbi:TonB-dependent receptor [Sphingomonas sp.]|uniref:TonB-dependent receptor n=1 Tax=Sphingomonas sp. TaxID=28214 RepID=UPI003B000A9E
MTRHRFAAGTALAAVLAIASPAFAQSQPEAANTPTPGAAGPTPSAQPSDAQSGQVADIIVTATKRETALQRTPIAISAFGQKQLDQYQVKDLTQIAQFVPSLEFNQQGDQSAVLLTLRGIGNDSAFTEVADPEVALYVDGIYSPRAQGASVLAYDLERIEVLRGPQGTLFGRNATVGAVSFITAKPTFDGVHGYGEVLGGSYNRLSTQGMLNLPITDTLAIRAAFITDRNDGYVSYQQPPNIAGVNRSAFVTDGKKYYAKDQKSARLSAEWRPSDRFRWDLNSEYFKDTGSPIIGLMQDPRPGEKFWSTLSDTAGDQNRYSISIHSNMSYDVTDGVQLAYLAGWQRVGGSTRFDADSGTELPDPASPTTLPNGAFEENRTVNSRYDFYSHEVQVKSIGNHPIDWIVGGYYSHERNEIRFDVDIRNGYRNGTFNYAGAFIQADRTIESKAAFGQATWHINDRLRLTGGVRYTDDTKQDKGGRNVTAFNSTCAPGFNDATGTCGGLFGIAPHASGQELADLLGFNISKNDVKGSWDKVTWLGRVDADITSSTFGYASVSTGFKSGNIEDGGLLANPETLTNYEVGLKQRFLDGRATLNLAAYYSDFKGYQVNQAITTRDPNDPTIITGSQIVTTNSKGATAKGIEAELAANVTRLDHLNFAGSVQKTRFKRLLTVDGRLYNASVPANIENLRGNELAHSPRFSFTSTYIHDFELPNAAKLSPRVTVHYETRSWLTYFNGDDPSRYADPTHVSGNGGAGYGYDFDKQKAYARVDLALTYTPDSGRYLIEAFAQNVTDHNIRISAGSYGAPQNPIFLSNYAPPRTFGGRIRYNF